LQKYLDSALGAWSQSQSGLDRFFREGESAQKAEEFMKVLIKWTQDISGSLLEGPRTLFQFLCALEESDRMDWIVEPVWPNLWKALGRGESAPDLATSLSTLKSAGLVDSQGEGEQTKYVIHPGVAQAGLQEADEKFREAVDLNMALFWRFVFDSAGSGGAEEQGHWIIMAGLRSAPYLMRLKRWSEASTMLEQAIIRDQSPETIASVLPLLRHIEGANVGREQELIDSGVLANALRKAGRWQEAEEILCALIPACIAKKDFYLASVSVGHLFNILMQTGRYNKALELAEEMKTYIQKADLGPWTKLGVESRRMQALNAQGRYEEVLEAVDRLRVQMKDLPEKGNQNEAEVAWIVREGILDRGCEAAVRSQKHELALKYNAEQIEIKKLRGATELDQARTSFNAYGPLLILKRYDEAEWLLTACRKVFEQHRSIEMLGMVFGALADLAIRQGHGDQAVDFEETALRYSYIFGDPETIAISHNNLASYLGGLGSETGLNHRLAGGLIRFRTSSGMLDSSLRGLSRDLDKFGSEALPGSFAELCDSVEKVDGVRFRELWERLPKQEEDGDKLRKELIEAARGAKQ
jgi:tetratricopeptide (TPR) repeat protein